MQGKFVDIMRGVNPENKEYVRYEHGQEVLCFLVLREIYWCIDISVMVKPLCKSAERYGFQGQYIW